MPTGKYVGFVPFFALLCILCSAAEDRRFTVRDSIEMARFNGSSDRDPGTFPLVSPDGRYSLVVTSHGSIESNKVTSIVWLFDNAALRRFLRENGVASNPPEPRRIARWGAVPLVPVQYPYHPVVSELRWAPDSRSIYFLALNSAGKTHLCVASVATRLVRSLTSLDYDIERYSLFKDGLVYVATRSDPKSSKESSPKKQNTDAATPITGKRIEEILFPDGGGAPIPQTRELWVVRNERTHRITDPNLKLSRPDFTQYMDTLSVSPDHNYVVQVKPMTHIEEQWNSYLPMAGHETWRSFLNISPSNDFQPRQYVLVNLSSGVTVPLIDAPFAWILGYPEFPQAVWAPDQKRLLLTNTFLPLTQKEDRQGSPRLRPCTVAIVEMSSNKANCIVFSRDASDVSKENPAPLRLDDLKFGANNDEVILHLSRPQEKRNQTEWYRLSQGSWILSKVSNGDLDATSPGSDTAITPSDVSIRVKQTLNDPPALWALDGISGREKKLWDPNPQLANIRMGKVSIYRWKDKSGHEWAGGLVMPVEYVPGHRYPLVIQTHGFEDSQFMTDGEYPTAMAARPLASAGIIVLQVPTNKTKYLELEEAHLQVLGYEAAIDSLTTEGLVDPKRVGIVGFSRTCLYVETALIEDSDRYAAAVIADGVDNSYMQTLMFDVGRESQAQRIYDAAPFGAGLKRWLQFAPDFQLDRVHTPLMITAIAPYSVLQEWEIYSSLYQQKKPVDFIFFRNGQHILQRPLERLASQQGTVDWFRFWLQDYEQPHPEDRDEYARWQTLKRTEAGGQSGGLIKTGNE